MTLAVFCFPSYCLYSSHHYLHPGLSFLPQLLSISVRWDPPAAQQNNLSGHPSVIPVLGPNQNIDQASPFCFVTPAEWLAFSQKKVKYFHAHVVHVQKAQNYIQNLQNLSKTSTAFSSCCLSASPGVLG